MMDLLVEKLGPANIAAVFHEDGGEGFFVLYDSTAEQVLRQVRVYERLTVPGMPSAQVEVLWSADEQKAGLVLWGRMRALLPTDETKTEIVCKVERPEDPAVDDLLLVDFPHYFDRRTMLDARKEYWTDLLLQSNPEAVISRNPLPLIETAFMKVHFDSERERAALFEDDGETGYMYVFFTQADQIKKHLHLYDRNPELTLSADDVDVLWSTDESKCAVSVWGTIRGIIDLRLGKEGRVWLESKQSPGISDQAWLKGFEVM